ncbi:GGDEF domain-containing protein [Candidatus Stoquefichus sp. SB1]|uniref:GGDEF domain-containing protein n=1 Tax=Candidatus Stoquefichus sp. SB1 TaxID=1658109 RepID=UPI00067ED0E1|nr:GGDEF domain-containing protein [Candidatus Stoquefichus sp. SB1]
MKYMMWEQLLESFKDTVLFQYDCHTNQIIYYPSSLFFYLNEEQIPKTIHPYEQDQLRSLFKEQSLYQDGQFYLRVLSQYKQELWCTLQYQYIYEEKTYIVGKITNVDRLFRQMKYFVEKSERDSFTGLFNKMTVEQKISEQLKICYSGMLLMMDIDGFKDINDHYGHLYGDKVLQWLTKRLQDVFYGDILGRVGGDEFIVFVKDIEHYHSFTLKIENLIHELKDEHLEFKQLSISIGISRYPEDGESYIELYDKADQAMYDVKHDQQRNYNYYQITKED